MAEWSNSLNKGLKEIVGKSKVIVCSSGGKMIVNSGKWPCGVCCCLPRPGSSSSQSRLLLSR